MSSSTARQAGGLATRAVADASFMAAVLWCVRLWAILVQLRYMDGDGEQLKVLKQALGEVPKSGEVWCEVSQATSPAPPPRSPPTPPSLPPALTSLVCVRGLARRLFVQGARIHLSPLSRSFDLDTAEQYLDFAIQFTPQVPPTTYLLTSAPLCLTPFSLPVSDCGWQYGDSFLELLRLVLIREVIVPRAKRLMERRAQQAAKAAEQEGEGGGDAAGGKAKAEEAEDDEPAPDEQTFLSTDTTELELR